MSRNENIDDRLDNKFQDLEEQFERISSKSAPYIKEISRGFNDGRDKLLAENRSLMESLDELDKLLERANSTVSDYETQVLLKQVYEIRDQVLNYSLKESKIEGPFYDFIVKKLIADPRNVVTINRLFGNGGALINYFTFFLTELDRYRHPTHVCEAIIDMFKWNSQDIIGHGIDFLSKNGACTRSDISIRFKDDHLGNFERYMNNNMVKFDYGAIEHPVFVAVYVACTLIRWSGHHLHSHDMHFMRLRGAFEFSIKELYNTGVDLNGRMYVRRYDDEADPPRIIIKVPPHPPNLDEQQATKYKRVVQNVPVQQSRIPVQQSRATIKKLKPVVPPRIMWEEFDENPLPGETPETITRIIANLHKFLQSVQRESTKIDLAMLDAIYRQKMETAGSIRGLSERNEAIFKVNLEYFYNMRKLNS